MTFFLTKKKKKTLPEEKLIINGDKRKNPHGDKRKNPQSNIRTLKTALGQVMLHQFIRYLNKRDSD